MLQSAKLIEGSPGQRSRHLSFLLSAVAAAFFSGAAFDLSAAAASASIFASIRRDHCSPACQRYQGSERQLSRGRGRCM